ncbi:DUF6496 domain-containing protein [Acidipila rosea]|uniref:Uncharacterized protein n=1 Tax=Acidipila rosea TaxID=768535 RepID=A0A4V2PUV2_9BACT|nr:DUF6496 domain-containing protein [Acidipila rosea]MBW4028094.1 histone H1-like protein [Acidobacteriota bacterium]MBW4046083.1 histone H1-like protein [Acidobacteriota bacterium]TCK71931.1 hypothetical protein C7378_2554 [Acidipila rosea]
MATAKKSSSTKKGSGRKYSPSASADVEREMKAMKKGKLKSGRSGKKVTNPKQAIAIGLSEARAEGKKAPPPPKKSASAKKKSAAKKNSGSKKSTAKKGTARKSSGAKKSSSKKSSGRKSSKA